MSAAMNPPDDTPDDVNEARERTLADPYVQAFPETQAFWLASAQGRFVLPRCLACARLHWHPRAFCPFCHGDALEWIDASGTGEVYSFSILRRAEAAHVLAYVKLDEGPILMTNIVELDDAAALRIGQRVEVVFRGTAQGRMAPVFRPCRKGPASGSPA